MRKYIKVFLDPFLRVLNNYYSKRSKKFSYKKITVSVEPSVFPPFLTYSTDILLNFVDRLELNGKTFLEFGCGCGIISILAAQKGGIVTSTDINEIALNALIENSKANQVTIEILRSDLFESLGDRNFDFIIVNPPYYPKIPKSMADKAWFCGENFEYFEGFFKQFKTRNVNLTHCYMILSQDCNMLKIKNIAELNKLKLQVSEELIVKGEKNFIFRIIGW